MAKFPTEVEQSITVQVPPAQAYRYLWNVVGSSTCIAGLEDCKSVGKDIYRFAYKERSTGPVSLSVCYTARYTGNGKDEISFQSTAAAGDNTDVEGAIRLQPEGKGTRIVVRQMIAPDTPIPRLLQSLIKSFVEREAADGMRLYLANVKHALETSKAKATKSKV